MQLIEGIRRMNANGNLHQEGNSSEEVDKGGKLSCVFQFGGPILMRFRFLDVGKFFLSLFLLFLSLRRLFRPLLLRLSLFLTNEIFRAENGLAQEGSVNIIAVRKEPTKEKKKRTKKKNIIRCFKFRFSNAKCISFIRTHSNRRAGAQNRSK